MSDFKNTQELERRLWDAADELRANTGLTSQEYSRPVLGLIFLRYAEYRFERARERLAGKKTSRRRGAYKNGGTGRGRHVRTQGRTILQSAETAGRYRPRSGELCDDC